MFCIIKNTGSFVESDNINFILEKTFTSNSNKSKDTWLWFILL